MFSFDPQRGIAVKRRMAAWIDTGAFGKGAALRSVRSLLGEFDVDGAVVNLGGQVLVYGAGCRHRILVTPPSGQGAPAAELELVAASAATTGHSERPGHLLDPRSGHPTAAWGSVTVVDPDPFVADVLSTALYVMGPSVGLDWATEAGDIAALFVIEIGDRMTTLLTPALLEHMGSPETIGSANAP
jgi:thiamine biosynthesis lipoprotein